ncbi:hypothetical protein EMIHUDRAFT_224875 [Emiliania huxleyi CCMP1516]|uniref:Uncharacterized protein n=2 Tax=Emiliania huxleyi TaxID=2903 RepID=A0A0D3KQ67_EMIH1|nr:hypothetical protein EMIHUDRAFT_224875 [Emiliania huxleyi CCMP1516]EOD37902.1 hypothetical protein EMIHUDRAFT_224875 [Emiliania huxleyi CCMP1516]|eukprot:XP_005790331.1 hypothetical protein EMIHUDRAFT_224875 [Emiliania huxleyi CCMP1516]
MAGPSQEHEPPSQEPEAPTEGTEAPAAAAEAAKKAEEARLLQLLATLTEERIRFGITAESQAAASAEVAKAGKGGCREEGSGCGTAA